MDARPTARLDRNREVLLVWFTPPVPIAETEAADGATSQPAAADAAEPPSQPGAEAPR